MAVKAFEIVRTQTLLLENAPIRSNLNPVNFEDFHDLNRIHREGFHAHANIDFSCVDLTFLNRNVLFVLIQILPPRNYKFTTSGLR